MFLFVVSLSGFLNAHRIWQPFYMSFIAPLNDLDTEYLEAAMLSS